MSLRRVFPAFLLLVLLPGAGARAGVELTLGSLAGEGWQASGVTLQLASDATDRYRVAGSVQELVTALGVWTGVVVRCDQLTRSQDGYRCPALTLTAENLQGPQQLTGELRFRDAGDWSLKLDGFRLAGGRWRLAAATQAPSDEGWAATLSARDVRVAHGLKQFPQRALPNWAWQGRLDLTIKLGGHDLSADRATLRARLRGGGWASADGLQAAEKLTATLRGDARRRGRNWSGTLDVRWQDGQLYSDPVYLDFGKYPVSVRSHWRWADGPAVLALTDLRAALGDLLTISGRLDVPRGQVTGLGGRLGIAAPDLARVYPVLIQPLGYGGALGTLQLAGGVQAQMTLEAGSPATVSAQLADVHVDDTQGRFGLNGLNGSLEWAAGGSPPDSRVRWRGGHVYRVDFNRSEAVLNLRDKAVVLRQPLVLPMLDGRLRIPRLSSTDIGGTTPSWRTSLFAETLSLPLLTRALGWPALSGELSVQIPDMHYVDGVLALDGELLAQVFDGTVQVSGLELRDPLSPAPVLLANVALQGLDLQRITGVFDFGRITGRLAGKVAGLQLVGWQPVAFQAVLETPPDDDLPHRISQRAVENLTALGNNGAVALSGTFLRVFESFRYDRLLLRVNLSGQRALLDGIPHPDGGYYLVKGAGLPRIDVIGRNRDVAWRDLVERLRRISLKGVKVR